MSDTIHPMKGIFFDPDDYDYNGGQLQHNLILFGRVCKALGMNVTPNRMMDVARALEHIWLGNKLDFYYTLRTHIVSHPKEFESFDEAFSLFWKRPSEGFTALNLQGSFDAQEQRKRLQFLPPLGSGADDEQGDATQLADPDTIAIMPTYSQHERLSYKSFADMTPDELEMAKRVIENMPDTLGNRKTRRFESGKGRVINMRRLMKDMIRKHGDITHIPTHRQKEKPRPVVLLCDISGSMERYTRILLHFMHTLAGTAFQVETFLYSTDITRITRQIRQKNVDDALADIGQTVQQWGGGTMTGEALHKFNWQWSRRVLGRGAVVIIITDGWDRGDIPMLHNEMLRLRRSCQRLIWLNPLLDIPQYEPLTRGAQALLPYVDDFLPITNLSNLEAIINALKDLKARPTAIAYRKKYLETT
jgi:uncharacterized protein with von Willebrand factor type A (vWA) domain